MKNKCLRKKEKVELEMRSVSWKCVIGKIVVFGMIFDTFGYELLIIGNQDAEFVQLFSIQRRRLKK